MKFSQDEQGHNSASRLIFIIGSIWNMAMITVMAFALKLEIGSLIAFYGAIQGILVSLKLGQKGIEKKKSDELS